MKKIVLIVITVMVLFGFAACDLINCDAVDKVINETLRDNELDSGFWDRRSSFPVEEGLGSPVTFVIDGKGYVGLYERWGVDDDIYNELFMYDPETDRWTRKKDYPGNGKFDAASFIYNGEAYVAGGSSFDIANDKAVEINIEEVDSLEFWKYSPITDSWAEMAPIPDQDSENRIFQGNHWSIVYDGKGYLWASSSSSYFVYDFILNSWETFTGEYLYMQQDGFIHYGDSSKIYTVSKDTEYSEPDSDNTVTLESFNGFMLYSCDVTSLDSPPAALFSEQLSVDDYPVGIKKSIYEFKIYSYIPPVTLFTIGSKLYMFSSDRTGTDLMSFNLDGTGSPVHLDWPRGLTADSLFSDGWCTYPMVFDDKVYILSEDGSFYIYKP